MRARVGVASFGVVALVAVPSAAEAQYSGHGSAAPTLSTSSMVAPTGVGVSVSCKGANSKATITWVITTTAYASGYVLLTTANGAQQANQSVAGLNTVSTIYSIVKGTLYQFALESAYKNWTSPPTAYTASVNC